MKASIEGCSTRFLVRLLNSDLVNVDRQKITIILSKRKDAQSEQAKYIEEKTNK
jgi:hypothetical protein